VRRSVITDEIGPGLARPLDVCEELELDAVELRTLDGAQIIDHPCAIASGRFWGPEAIARSRGRAQVTCVQGRRSPTVHDQSGDFACQRQRSTMKRPALRAFSQAL